MKVSLGLVWFFVLFWCTPALGSNAGLAEAERAYQQARQLDAQARFSEALAFYQQACDLVENYKNCRGEIEETIVLLENEQSRRSNPTDPEILRRLALGYKLKKHYKKFFEMIFTSYSINPTAESAADLAIAYYDMGNLEKSLEMASAAFDLGPENYYAKVVYIAILIESGEREKGRELLASLNEEKIGKAAEWYNVSCSYAALGEAEAAVKYLQQAVEHDEKKRLLARSDKSFDGIREEKAFKELVYPEETAGSSFGQ